MRVLGIDPGYERVGVALLEKKSNEQLIYSDCFITPRTLSFPERLHLVGEEVERIVREYKPEVLALERVYFNTNQKTASMVSEVRGAILFIAGREGLRVFQYTPQKVKAAITGYGKGEKGQVTKMLHHLITIRKDITYDDEYDAIAVGLTCLLCERL